MRKPNNWQKILVAPDMVLSEAIQQMDTEGKRNLVVADEEQRLLGIVSDGDLRRALIRGIQLSDRVDSIMQSKPIVATTEWSTTRILACMERYQLLLLPVVDVDNKILSVEFLYDLLQKPRLDNAVCLMAGGFGTRLRPLTESCPKPMLKLGDKPILELIMQRFIQAGFHRFFISTHYMADHIVKHFGDGSKWGVSIEYVHEDEPLGTAGALGLLPKEQINEPMFVMNGDLLTDTDFLSLLAFHEEQGGDATMCVRQFEYQVPYGVVNTQGHAITKIVEKPVQHYFVNAGIYVLEPVLIGQIKAGEHLDMPALITKQLNKKRQINHFKLEQDWLDIGRLDDFKKARQIVSETLQDF